MAFRSYLEDEDDKPYYHLRTLAYYYENMEGFAEKVDNAAKTLNLTKEDIEKRISAKLDEWDQNIQAFPESVTDLLQQWTVDGTIDTVIQTALIDERIAPVTAQLAETSNQLTMKGNAIKFFAHRGAEAYAPENTMKAFEVAKEIGFDGIELDVLFTSDGVPIVHHDDTLERMTTGTGLVSSYTLEQIKSFNIDGGNFPNWHIGLKIPTLEEALLYCKKHQLEVLVELKTSTVTNLQAVESVVKRLGMYETAFILAPYGVANILETLNSKLKLYVFYMDNSGYRESLLKPNVIGVGIYPHSIATPEMVAEIRSFGKLINIATTQTVDVAKPYVDMGIDLITGGVANV